MGPTQAMPRAQRYNYFVNVFVFVNALIHSFSILLSPMTTYYCTCSLVEMDSSIGMSYLRNQIQLTR